MTISTLFVSTPTVTTAKHDTPVSPQKVLEACGDILLIGASCHKERILFKDSRGKIDHIDTHWLRNADLQDRIQQALTHYRYDAIVCCSEPLAPWMDLTEKEANDAFSLITASGYTLQMIGRDRYRDTA